MADNPTTLEILIDKPIGDGDKKIAPRWVANKLRSNPLATDILLKIVDCPGGNVDYGFSIYDLLTQDGRPIKTHIYGGCYSIATVIMCAGDEIYAAPNASILTHPAWAEFRANQYQVDEYKSDLQAADKRILAFYKKVRKVKTNDQGFEDFYRNERYMTPKEAIDFGLVDGLINSQISLRPAQIKAYAYLNNYTEMPDEKSVGLLEGIAKSISDLSNRLFKNVKNLSAVLENGTAVRIEGEAPAQGASVFITGADGVETPAPDGEHTLGGDLAGIKITVAGGVITAVTDMTEAEKKALQDEIAAKDAKILELEAQAKAATTKAEEATKSTEQFAADLKALQAQVAPVLAALAGQTAKPETAPQNFKQNGVNNAATPDAGWDATAAQIRKRVNLN